MKTQLQTTSAGMGLATILMVSGVVAQERAEMLATSDIVFTGTVMHHGTASFYGVPVSENTVVVRVDEVIDQPAKVALRAGDTVTVQVLDPAPLGSGVQATFYTQGWIFGEGVAVREVGHELVVQAAGVAQGQDAQTIRQQRQDEQLRARIAAADMVMLGRVVTVGPSTLSQFQAARPITEHDARWQEAVIEVETGIKGVGDAQRVVVRFPTSMDVQWFNAPRFAAGQEGVFICTTDQISGVQFAMLAGNQVVAYTALAAEDVLARDQAARVAALAQ
jgi:hypothetical protein